MMKNSAVQSCLLLLLVVLFGRHSVSSGETSEDGLSVLILGGAGFVGRHFVSRFCFAGWRVTLVDSLQAEDALTPDEWTENLQCPSENMRFFHENYLDYFDRMDSLLERNSNSTQLWSVFLYLVNIFGQSNGSKSSQSLVKAAQENLAIDNAALQWVVNDQCRRKFDKVVMVTFNSPNLVFSPSDGYNFALSKQSGRKLAQSLHKSHGLNVIQFEALHIYGEDMPPTSSLRSVIKQSIEKKNPLVIDVDANVNMLHVEEVVQCVVQNFNTVFDGSVITFVSEQSTNISAVAKHVAELLNYSPSIDSLHFLSDEQVNFFPNLNHVQICSSFKGINEVIPHWMESQYADNHEAEQMPEQGEHREPIYSSFKCSGGNQRFPDMKPFKNESLSDENRVCMFKNICVQAGQFLYFQHPEEAIAPEFVQVQRVDMVKMGLMQLIDLSLNFNLTVFPGTPLPTKPNFIDDKTWFMVLASFSDGIGHHLMDDLYPILAAMDMFDIPYEDVSLLYAGCPILDAYNEICVYEPSKFRGKVCHEYFEYFSKLLFNIQPMEIRSIMKPDNHTCFRRIAVGQNFVFNVDTVDKQRAVTLRKGRDLLIKRLDNMDILDHVYSLKDSFYMLIMPKNNPGFQKDPLWPTMCDDTVSILAKLGLKSLHIVCNPSGSIPRESEIFLINHASIVIAEHGTLSLMTAFYGRDDTVLITVGKNDAVKNMETLLYSLHLHVLYSTMENFDSMPSLFRYGLHLASSARNVTLDYSN